MVLQEGAVTGGDVLYGWMVVVNDVTGEVFTVGEVKEELLRDSEHTETS